MEPEITSVKTEEVAVPQLDTTTEPEGTGEAETSEVAERTQEPTVADKSFKDDPQNRAFAEMRRQIKEQDDWAKQNYGHLGINTMADYRKALDDQRKAEEAEAQQAREAEMLARGYDPEVIEVVREFKTIKQEREAEKKRQEAESLWGGLITDHATLKAKFGDLVPDIPTTGTTKEKVDALLATLDEQTVGLLYKGIPLKMAWKETNEDKILEHARKSATQQTLNNVAGKAHLGGDGGGGDNLDAVAVPPETLKMYRQMFPKATLQWIAEDYRKHNPRGG